MIAAPGSPIGDKSWSATVEPIATRLSVAAKFGQNFVHEPKGASSLAELLREMGKKPDLAIERLDRPS